MNIDKIGKFIKTLREEKKLTQEELAGMIPISRQAISKWERGLAIPDSSVLVRLSEIFSVTINEILSGEKINKNNEKSINQISLTLYKDRNKKKRIIKLLTFVLILLIFIFLIYYFISSYRSIRVYTISGSSKNISFNNGIFVRTNEKFFFRIGDFNYIDNNNKIKECLLYYVDKDGVQIEIASNSNDSIMFTDYKNYDEYLDTNKIDYIISNMYLKVSFEEFEETIKLKFIENYVNDNFFSKNTPKVGTESSNDSKFKLASISDSELINEIKKYYKLQDSNYIYNIKKDELTIEIYYYTDLETIKINCSDSNELVESWTYQISNSIMTYQNFKTNKLYVFKDGQWNCETCSQEELDNIVNEFYNILDESFDN